ncbi:hypothetical protein EIP91_009823, partial [Steccherinum ochraceum]
VSSLTTLQRQDPYPLRVNPALEPATPSAIESHYPDPLCLVGDEIVAAHNIANMLCSAPRAFASGMHVDGFYAMLWHGDDQGLSVTRWFHIIDSVHLLILAVAAMSNAHSSALGYIPYLHFPKTRPSTQLNGSKIKLLDVLNAKGEPVDAASFVVDINRKRIAFLASKATGRRTICLPVKAVKRQDSLKSATVYSPGPIAMKMGFWNEHDIPEEENIRLVQARFRQFKPEACKFVVDLICSATASIAELNSPRAFLGQISGIELREFRALAMPEYQALEHIRSYEDSEKVLSDAFLGHHWMWEYGRILHGDVSHNNIMWHVLRDGTVIGVLVDLDMAQPRERIEAKVRREEANVRDMYSGVTKSLAIHGYSGTLPCVATEALAPNYAPPKDYRPDVESFFWLFVIHFICHNIHSRSHHTNRLKGLFQLDALTVGRTKAHFLLENDVEVLHSVYFREVNSAYRHSIDTLILPLRKLFRYSGEHFRRNDSDDRLQHAFKLPKGELLFAMCMNVLGRENDCDCSSCSTICAEAEYGSTSGSDSAGFEEVEETEEEYYGEEGDGDDTEDSSLYHAYPVKPEEDSSSDKLSFE